MARRALALGLLGMLLFAGGAQAFTPWGAIYDAARDERSVGDIAADKEITTKIKAALVKKDGKLGLAVKTYCYLGRVTLLGQVADEGFKAFAVATAKKTRGVRGVAPHWEPVPRESTTKADLEIAARLRTALIEDKELSATQIETEVFSGKVYLIGMVRSSKDAARAEAHARAVAGVSAVVNLLVPPRGK